MEFALSALSMKSSGRGQNDLGGGGCYLNQHKNELSQSNGKGKP